MPFHAGLDRGGTPHAVRVIDAAARSAGQHAGPVHALQARHIRQDLDLWRRRLAEIDRLIATVGDPARFRSAAAFAAHVGGVPGLRQSGKRNPQPAPIGPTGHARLRMARWMPLLGAVRRNPWLRVFCEWLRGNAKLPKVARVAAMRKLLHAIYSVARHCKPFVIQTGFKTAA